MDKKEFGYLGEKIVALYLEKKGYKILNRNYCIKGGEIDIIASINDEIIAFIEVKTRTPDFLNSGFDAVTKKKRKLIIKTSEMYTLKNPHNLQPRFDVAQIVIDGKKVVAFNYIENAFDASDIDTIF